MKAWIKKVLFTFFTFSQIAAFSAASILEYLSDKKMGVARYLIYKEGILEAEFFRPDQMNLYMILLIIGFILSLMVLVSLFIKFKNNKITWSMSIGAAVTLITLVFVWLKGNIQLKAYYFFLIALVIIIIVQYLKLFLQIKGRRCIFKQKDLC